MVCFYDVLDAQRIVLPAELPLLQTQCVCLMDMVTVIKDVRGGWMELVPTENSSKLAVPQEESRPYYFVKDDKFKPTL